jgi:hypothetical protein
MALAKDYKKYIFCLEGDWNNDLRNKSSVQNALNLLEVNNNIDTIYKTCNTYTEFKTRLIQLCKAPKRYEKYSIIYLAFHGVENGLVINGDIIPLEKIAQDFEGKFKNKIIHFGSCSTIDIDEQDLEFFLNKTNALAVSGYKEDIDFISSTVFDILYFEMCQSYKNIFAINRNMFKNYKNLCDKLGFKIYS